MIEKHRREYLIGRIKKHSVLRESGCIEWIATKNNRGYGLIHFAIKSGDGRKASLTAHRAHYMAHHNMILARNEYVCHKCDNPACVNIDHLFLGSPKDNIQDMLAKGRNAKQYRLHKRLRDYDDDKIRAIKNAIGLLREVAEKYGVSVSYVSKLRAGKAKKLVNC